MKRRITMIKLKDGKQLFYPSESELLKLYDNIVEVRIEEILSREEYENSFGNLQIGDIDV